MRRMSFCKCFKLKTESFLYQDVMVNEYLVVASLSQLKVGKMGGKSVAGCRWQVQRCQQNLIAPATCDLRPATCDLKNKRTRRDL